LGWLSGRIGVLKHEDAGVLATYVIRFALPFSLFEGAISTSPADLLNFGLLGTLTLSIVGTYAIALAVGRFAFGHDLRTSAIQALICAFPDMAYFAAPVLAALFGPPGFLAILLGNLVVMILILPATIILTQTSGTSASADDGQMRIIGRSFLSALTNPIVWLPIGGVVLSLLHVTLPHSLTISIDMVGKSAGGTSLFALGLMLYGEPVRLTRNVLANVGLKNFVQPALMLAGAAIFALPHAMTQQAILTGAAPSATAASMFALKNKVYTADATSTVLVSTVLAIGLAALLIAVMF
jgi:predicted permease